MAFVLVLVQPEGEEFSCSDSSVFQLMKVFFFAIFYHRLPSLNKQFTNILSSLSYDLAISLPPLCLSKFFLSRLFLCKDFLSINSFILLKLPK